MGKIQRRYPVVWMVVFLVGCASLGVSGQKLVETEWRNVQTCQRLGVVSEIADPGKIIGVLDRKQMIGRVRARAVEMGATHLVWEFRTNEAASATAYRCTGGP